MFPPVRSSSSLKMQDLPHISCYVADIELHGQGPHLVQCSKIICHIFLIRFQQ